MAEKGYKPTEGMKSAARAALEWKKQGKRGGTAVGLARANQIVRGDTLSESTVKRMYSFFSRHEVDKKAKGFSPGEEGYPSPGRVAWNLWGGDAGFAFARGHVASMKKSIYDDVVNKVDEVFEVIEKVWTPEPGKVTPFSSSSSMHSEENDNHLEHYVQEDPKTPLEGAIASIFNSNFWTNGGEKMTEKTLDVDSSTTPKNQYDNPGTSTTEPDPQSEIAITKMDRPKDSADVEGKGTYSTTANTTEEAPKAGDTTEPTTKADGKCAECGKEECDCKMEKADACPDCKKSMSLCECAGMTKAEGDKCPHCGQAMKVKKSEESEETAEEEANETPEEEAKEDEKMEKKEFSTERREELADQKKAMPDGSYPIENEQDLKNAIRAWGRGGAKPEVKAHIKRRAKELGKESLIPETWKSEWAGFFSPEIKRGF